MKQVSISLAVVLAASNFAGAQASSASSGTPDTHSVRPWGMATNVGRASVGHVVVDGHLAFFVSELEEGRTDLNGNGFIGDHVVHVRNKTTGVVRNLALSGDLFVRPASDEFDNYGTLITFAAEESRDGDLNGDGDATDYVLIVYDFATDELWNTGHALAVAFSPHLSYFVDDGTVLGIVGEAEHGAVDLNGDGDEEDKVLFLFDPAGETFANTGFAVGADYQTLGFYRRWVGLAVTEAGQGALDLNGDGDELDHVLHVHDLQTGTTVNTGLATYDFAVATGEMLLLIRESEQGGVDLNGDGDTADSVAHVLHLATGTLDNLGLDATFFTVDVPGFNSQVDGTLGALVVSEARQGGTDLNGDGDAVDNVVHRIDLPSAQVTNLGYASFFARANHGLLSFLVREVDQGADLNGDLDVGDMVLFVDDVRTGSLVNTGLGVSTFSHPGARGVAFLVSENDQAETDLNQDGDDRDRVLYFYDRERAEVVNVRLAVDLYRVVGKRVVLEVEEDNQSGVDLNGDGDAADDVTHVFDVDHRSVINTGLESFAGADGGIVPGVIFERWVGDYNGDGDGNDRVLHFVVL